MRRQDPWCAYNQEWQWFVFADVLVEKDAIHASIPARRYGFLKRRIQKGCSVRLRMFQQTREQPSLRNAS